MACAKARGEETAEITIFRFDGNLMLTREMQYAILKVHRLCDGYLFRKENKKIGKK